MKKNKIVVVADRSGKIIGCALPSEEVAQPTEPKTTFAAMPGQTVHEVEIPQELVEHLGRPSFAEEIFRYRVGRNARLVRAKARRKKSQPRARR